MYSHIFHRDKVIRLMPKKLRHLMLLDKLEQAEPEKVQNKDILTRSVLGTLAHSWGRFHEG